MSGPNRRWRPTRANPPYWPGGIPSHIRCHAEPISRDVLTDEVKGWLLFLDENIITLRPENRPPGDDDFELNQRRRLVSQWASLPQADRDAYQSRAEPRSPYYKWRPPPGTFKADHDVVFRDDTSLKPHTVHCVLPQPMSSRSRAIFTKLRIMLYELGGEDGPFIDDDAAVVVCVPNPALGPGAAVESGQDLVMWRFVENADFNSMFMTSTGTVIIKEHQLSELVLIDQEALDTGRVHLCSFENNGQLHRGCHVRPQVILRDWWTIFVNGLGWGVDNLMDEKEIWKSNSRPDAPNGPLNMEQPILDILEDCKPYLDGGIDEWMDDIERYAPGYLEMEEAGNGMAPDYDNSRFRTREQLVDIPREEFDNTRVICSEHRPGG